MRDYLNIIKSAENILPIFGSIVDSTSFEAKGVLYSDILFMLACLEGVEFKRVLESGRARGQSTLLLSRALPNHQIVSIEYDKNSPDAPIAHERLSDSKNVTLLFGDSRELLPKMVQYGDVVIIDGPKMFLAIRLAIKLLGTGKVSYVFIHDMTWGIPWRAFLDRFFPEARFSDNVGIAKITSVLDTGIQSGLPPSHKLGGFVGEYGYGYALACIPLVNGRWYKVLYVLSFFYDLFEPNPIVRIRRKIRKIFSHQ